MGFSANFVWGAAAASYQIEGAAWEDGKKSSVWDMMCARTGAIYAGHTGTVACDHYHRYKDDVGLMKAMGLKAYRLSISWPRVLPDGVGAVNEKGFAFYDALIDELLQAGITPYVTLFHWDFPYELYLRGGWLNPASQDWFAEYTTRVVKRLGDRVTHWMTLNEPQCHVVLGHQDGRHAPGDKLADGQVLQVMHNSLLAHGRSVQAIRAASPQACQVGIAPIGGVLIPKSDDPVDVEIARQAMFTVHEGQLWSNPWWFGPVFEGAYPEDGMRQYGKAMPTIASGDMDIIRQPLDFLGLNIYNGHLVGMTAEGQPGRIDMAVGHARTANNWPVTPEALYWGPKFYHERYNIPIYITENGLSNQDWVFMDGKVHDPQRIDFTRRYLLQLRRAAEEGVNVAGYFHWSVMDNFEWGEGYKERFGLIHVDFNSQQRTLKDSAYWYKEVIETNGDCL